MDPFLNGLSLKALEIAVKPFGYLGLLYNQGAQKNPHSYVGTLARLGVDFSYSNGWSFGIGAIGAWNIYNKQRLANLYISLGNFLVTLTMLNLIWALAMFQMCIFNTLTSVLK